MKLINPVKLIYELIDPLKPNLNSYKISFQKKKLLNLSLTTNYKKTDNYTSQFSYKVKLYKNQIR